MTSVTKATSSPERNSPSAIPLRMISWAGTPTGRHNFVKVTTVELGRHVGLGNHRAHQAA